MSMVLELPEAVRKRVEDIAARSGRSAAEIVLYALDGRSLDWQENYIKHVEEGLEDARNGNFATEEELDAVVNKYRPDHTPAK